LSGADFILVDVREIVPSDSTLGPTTLPVYPAELPPAEYVVEDWRDLRLSPPIELGGTRYLSAGVQLRQGGEVYGTAYILYPERLWRDALWGAIQPSLVLGVIGSVASLVLAVVVSGRLARRVQALERRTRLIAQGDFSPMTLPRRNDEFRDLSQSINLMASQLAKLQETIKQTERLRLLGQVSGGLAHQLRNSVTGARLAVQLHARKCDGQGDGEALDVALRQLDLVEANLKRFLDLGRPDPPRREPCDLPAILGEVVTLLRPQCQHAHTELRWQRPALGVQVQGDPGQLRHLFLNVIGNAIEAAGPGGWVTVSLQQTTGREGVSVEVVDSGPGPPAEIAERLFQPFVTGKREGVGLGLAVARQAAESHGGRLDWQRDAAATCFRIELPTGCG
ncbi:MAG: HAMP domain-containing histidine kinase, partial [Planctomycetia bacterium]|nr:HAMP domain-containing histidine kinase [Planctomycetia bacterium]